MRTLSDTIIELIHVEILDIWGEDAVEQLSTVGYWAGSDRSRVRTMFKTSFAGSDHHTMAE